MFAVKVYPQNEKDYPYGGKFGRYLERDKDVGDNVFMSGPHGRMKYMGWG